MVAIKSKGRGRGGRGRVSNYQRGYLRTAGYYGRYQGSGGESKFFDTTVAQTVIPATGNFMSSSLNLIPQGVTESTRIGRKCIVTSIHIRGRFVLPENVAPTLTTDIIRVIVYKDKQANGATVGNVSDILENPDIHQFRNLANTQRFQILLDEQVPMSATAGAFDGSAEQFAVTSIPFTFNKRCNIPLEFSATTGAITEIRSNNIGVLTITESGLIIMQYTARVRFSEPATHASFHASRAPRSTNWIPRAHYPLLG